MTRLLQVKLQNVIRIVLLGLWVGLGCLILFVVFVKRERANPQCSEAFPSPLPPFAGPPAGAVGAADARPGTP